MVKISSVMDALINRPASYLSEDSYARWISLLASARVTARERRLRRIRVARTPMQSGVRGAARPSWLVSGHPEGSLASPGAIRANRWLMGRSRAAQRVWDRYGMAALLSDVSMTRRPTGLVDVGANMGEFTLKYLEEFAGPVLAFEPDSHARACLEWNIKSDRVSISPLALSDKDGTGLLLAAAANGDSTLEVDTQGHGATVEVRLVRLDGMDLSSLGRHPLLKMDAEGHEPEVLAGAGEALRQFSWVAIDGGPERRGQETRNDVADVLTEHGFLVTFYGNQIVHGLREDDALA